MTMFTLMIHKGYGYTETISKHRTASAANRALESAIRSAPHITRTSPLAGRYFVKKPTTLLTSAGIFTLAYYRISAACASEGIHVTRRAKGFSDYSDLMNLVSEGLLEIRNRGPRGGKTWHATRRGRRAIAKAIPDNAGT